MFVLTILFMAAGTQLAHSGTFQAQIIPNFVNTPVITAMTVEHIEFAFKGECEAARDVWNKLTIGKQMIVFAECTYARR